MWDSPILTHILFLTLLFSCSFWLVLFNGEYHSPMNIEWLHICLKKLFVECIYTLWELWLWKRCYSNIIVSNKKTIFFKFCFHKTTCILQPIGLDWFCFWENFFACYCLMTKMCHHLLWTFKLWKFQLFWKVSLMKNKIYF